MSMLIVDDSRMICDMLCRFLRGRGHVVEVANSGEEALEVLGKTPFELILLDVEMPGKTGLEVLQGVRTTKSRAELPIIMITGREGDQEVVQALELGANDFISKPFNLPVLDARIHVQLGLKRALEHALNLEKELAQRNKELKSANRQLHKSNQRMRRDLHAAAKIQEALLPREFPELPDLSFAYIFKPCRELGGDGLNIFRLDEFHIGMYVLDVSGHGLPAALLSASLSRLLSPGPVGLSILKERVDQAPGYRILPPTEVADALTRKFPFDPATEQFFTIQYGIVNQKTGEFKFVSAGHPGPLHLHRDGAAVIQRGSGPPIGLAEIGYEEQAVTLRDGDRLFLFSDGVTEAIHSQGELYGKARLGDVVSRGRSAPLDECLLNVLAEVKQWSGATRLRDDFTILAVERARTPVRRRAIILGSD